MQMLPSPARAEGVTIVIARAIVAVLHAAAVGSAAQADAGQIEALVLAGSAGLMAVRGSATMAAW